VGLLLLLAMKLLAVVLGLLLLVASVVEAVEPGKKNNSEVASFSNAYPSLLYHRLSFQVVP
jgi:hypothetical protein